MMSQLGMQLSGLYQNYRYEMVKNLLIFGCGYTARYLGKSLVNEGWEVAGTIRSIENREKLIKSGIRPVFWEDEEKIQNIMSSDCSVISSIPPNSNGDVVLSRYYDFMISRKKKLNWLGFLSSTGVYGNRLGNWVTEESVTDTITANGRLRLKAEDNWLEFSRATKIPTFIFRIAGIYGPGRSVFDRIKNGKQKKIYKKNQYFNRIHVDDIVGAISTALKFPNLHGIYNLSDDLPSYGGEVIDEATKLLNLPRIEEVDFLDADLSEAAKSFYLESKKVCNNKLRQALGYSLKFPNYKSGLQSILEASKNLY